MSELPPSSPDSSTGSPPDPYRTAGPVLATPNVDLKRRWKIGGLVVAGIAVASVVAGLTIGSPKADVVLVSASPFLIIDVPRAGTGDAPIALGFVLEILNQRETPAKVDSIVLEGAVEDRPDRTCAATGPVRLEAIVGKALGNREELYVTMASGPLYSMRADSVSEARPCLALRWTAVIDGSSFQLVPTTQPDAQFIPAARWGVVADLVRGEKFVRANILDLLKLGGPEGAPPSLAPLGTGAPATAAPATAAPATTAPETAVPSTTVPATPAPATPAPAASAAPATAL